MLICCRVKDSASQERSLVFEGSSVIIGSSGDVRVEGARPLHASIEQRGGQYFVVDKSGGDTLCNGQPVQKEQQIRPGDKITVHGVDVVFLLTDQRAEVTAAPTDAAAPAESSAGVPAAASQAAHSTSPATAGDEKSAPPSLPTSAVENTATGSGSTGPVTLGPVMGLNDIQAQRKATATPPAPATTLRSESAASSLVEPSNLAPSKSAAHSDAERSGVAARSSAAQPSAAQSSAAQPKAAQAGGRAEKGWFGTFAPPTQSAIDLKPKTGNAVEVSVLWGDRLVMMRHFKKPCDVYVGSDPSNDVVLPMGVGAKRHKLFTKAAGGSVAVRLPQTLGDGELVNKSGSKTLSSLNYGPGASVSLGQAEMLRLNMHDKVQLVVRYTEEAPDVVGIANSDFAMRETAGFLLAAMVAIVFSLYMSLYTSYTFQEDKIEERERKATIVFKPVQKAQKIKKKTVTRVRTVKDPGKGQVKKAKKAVKKVKAQAAKKTAKKSGASAKSKPPPKPSLESAGLLAAFGGGGIHNDVSKSFDGTGELLGDAQKATGRSGMGEDRAGVKMGLQTSRGKRDTVGAAAVRTGGKGSGAFGSGVGGLGAKGKMNLNLDVDDIETSSSIDREAIRRVVRRNVPAIRACYNQELNRNKNLRGKVVVEWDIADAGRVVGTRVKSNSMANRRVADCIRRLIATLTFPSPGANEVARVAFPFVFASSGR